MISDQDPVLLLDVRPLGVDQLAGDELDAAAVGAALGLGRVVAGDRLGRAEGRPDSATMVLVAETGLAALIADLPRALPARAVAVMGVARLPRRGALVRGLAGDAPSLSEALHTVWTVARARLLGLSPLSLRKL